jgi:protein arginine kinase activator
MDCDFCSSKATVFLTQLVEGEMKKLCLCEKCANEKGVTDPTGFSLADEVLGGGAGGSVSPADKLVEAAPMEDGPECSNCGFTFAKFQQVGRLGCSVCYETFRDDIVRRLKGMHKGTTHAGRVPEGLMAAFERQQRLDRLNERLAEAIASENYEEAAGLRDEIQEVESAEVVES